MRIGISGTHNSGKSTLAKAIAEKYPHEIISGVAHFVKKEHRTSLGNQYDILQHMIAAEKAKPQFINDRSVFDCLAYFSYHFKSDTKYLGVYSDYHHTLLTYLNTKPYDLIIYVDDMLPVEDNGIRDSVDNQEEIHNNLKAIVPFYTNMFGIKTITVRGSTIARMKKVTPIIKKLYPQKRVEDFA